MPRLTSWELGGNVSLSPGDAHFLRGIVMRWGCWGRGK